MFLDELVEGKVYTDDKNLFKVDGNKIMTKNKNWIDATEIFSIAELAIKYYYEYKPKLIVFTEEEKELAKHALALGIKVIVKEGGNFYCSTDDDIWIGNFDTWESNNDVWFDECELPLLLKSSLAEKAKENTPLYLEDVVK